MDISAGKLVAEDFRGAFEVGADGGGVAVGGGEVAVEADGDEGPPGFGADGTGGDDSAEIGEFGAGDGLVGGGVGAVVEGKEEWVEGELVAGRVGSYGSPDGGRRVSTTPATATIAIATSAPMRRPVASRGRDVRSDAPLLPFNTSLVPVDAPAARAAANAPWSSGGAAGVYRVDPPGGADEGASAAAD